LLRKKLHWLGGASFSSQNTLREFCSGNFEKNILIFVPEFCAGKSCDRISPARVSFFAARKTVLARRRLRFLAKHAARILFGEFRKKYFNFRSGILRGEFFDFIRGLFCCW